MAVAYSVTPLVAPPICSGKPIVVEGLLVMGAGLAVVVFPALLLILKLILYKQSH